MFVRKRDPRYKAYIARQAQPPGQATPTPASGSQTPRKTAPKSTFVAQDWQKVAETSDATADLEWARAEGAEDEEWECIACNKTFRSEAAWNGHERSKKHLRAVEQLKRVMQDEEHELDLGQSYDEPTDADVKVHQRDDQVGQGTAGANATVHSSGDKDPPEATPDRGTSTATPKEEEENTTIEGKDLSSSPIGREQQRTDKKARTPSPPPLTPPISKSPQKGRARNTRASSPRQQVGDDLKFSEENPQHTGREDEDDGVPVGEDGGAENPTKGEALSKREKRRAREAAKKAREGEAKSVSAVSFLTLASFHSHALLKTVLPPHRAFFLVSRVELPPFGFFIPHGFYCQLITSRLNSATFAVRRLTAGQNCSNMSTAKAMHWQIHVIEIRRRKRERRRSSRGDMMDHFRTRGPR